MKTQTIIHKKSANTESVDPLWEELKRGFEDIKAGRVSIWKPRHLR